MIIENEIIKFDLMVESGEVCKEYDVNDLDIYSLYESYEFCNEGVSETFKNILAKIKEVILAIIKKIKEFFSNSKNNKKPLDSKSLAKLANSDKTITIRGYSDSFLSWVAVVVKIIESDARVNTFMALNNKLNNREFELFMQKYQKSLDELNDKVPEEITIELNKHVYDEYFKSMENCTKDIEIINNNLSDILKQIQKINGNQNLSNESASQLLKILNINEAINKKALQIYQLQYKNSQTVYNACKAAINN